MHEILPHNLVKDFKMVKKLSTGWTRYSFTINGKRKSVMMKPNLTGTMVAGAGDADLAEQLVKRMLQERNDKLNEI